MTAELEQRSPHESSQTKRTTRVDEPLSLMLRRDRTLPAEVSPWRCPVTTIRTLVALQPIHRVLLEGGICLHHRPLSVTMTGCNCETEGSGANDSRLAGVRVSARTTALPDSMVRAAVKLAGCCESSSQQTLCRTWSLSCAAVPFWREARPSSGDEVLLSP